MNHGKGLRRFTEAFPVSNGIARCTILCFSHFSSKDGVPYPKAVRTCRTSQFITNHLPDRPAPTYGAAARKPARTGGDRTDMANKRGRLFPQREQRHAGLPAEQDA